MDLIIVPFHDCKKWISEGYRTRDAHLVQHICKSDKVGKVLVVNRPVSLAEAILKRISWKTPKTEILDSDGLYCLSKVKDKLYVVDSFLPDTVKVVKEKKAWWFSAFEDSRTINSIKRAIDYLDLEDPVILLQNPMAIGAVKYIDHSVFAFDAIDNWLFHPQMKTNHELVKRGYDYMQGNADVIFTVSKALKDFFSTNGNTHWIPNGVDSAFFRPARRPYDNGPVTIGYMGKIQDRVDFELVEQCLQAYENIDFVFAGPVYAQKNYVKKLKKEYKNITFTGDVYYNNLPQVMRQFDLTLIPHKVDSFTSSMNPLKLYEYLAAGKPVITTKVAGVNNISPYVFVSDTNQDFIHNIEIVINELKSGNITPDLVAETVPENCSWEYKTNQILSIINSRLSGDSK